MYIGKDEVAEYLDKNKYKTKDFLCFIESLCELIEEDDANNYVIDKLGLLLKERNSNKEERKQIIEILMKYNKNSKKPRAGNIFLNEAEILEGKTILKSKPRILCFLLTYKCNLKCIMCCNGYDKEYELDDRLYKYIVDNIMYFQTVNWKGGEVFLYKYFKNLLKLAIKYNVKQEITTNALLLNEEIIELLASNGVELSISIDAVTKDLYEKIRKGGNFEKLLTNLNLLLKAKKKYPKFDYHMATVLMKENYKTINDIIDFAIKYGFSSLYCLACDEVDWNKHLILSKEDLFNVKKEISNRQFDNFMVSFDLKLGMLCENKDNKYENNKNIVSSDKKTDELDDSDKSIYCNLPWKKMIVDDLSISFDCHCNSIDIDYNDIWNSKSMIEYRKNIIQNRENICRIFLGNK